MIARSRARSFARAPTLPDCRCRRRGSRSGGIPRNGRTQGKRGDRAAPRRPRGLGRLARETDFEIVRDWFPRSAAADGLVAADGHPFVAWSVDTPLRSEIPDV